MDESGKARVLLFTASPKKRGETQPNCTPYCTRSEPPHTVEAYGINMDLHGGIIHDMFAAREEFIEVVFTIDHQFVYYSCIRQSSKLSSLFESSLNHWNRLFHKPRVQILQFFVLENDGMVLGL